MTLLEAVRKSRIGDRLKNTKLKADFEWNGSIWDIPSQFYNLNYPGWEVIDYISESGVVKG